MMRRRLIQAIAASVLLGLVAPGLFPEGTAALTCATPPPNAAELAIDGKWPQDAVYDFVLIGVVRSIDAVRNDAGTYGQWLHVDVDATLRGEPLARNTAVFNPPLGSAGWIGFTVGGRFLIAGGIGELGLGTSLCTPNRPVESAAEFERLVAFSNSPTFPDTAIEPPAHSGVLSGAGFALLFTALLLLPTIAPLPQRVRAIRRAALRRLSDRLRERRGPTTG